jgi:hypothetical protein
MESASIIFHPNFHQFLFSIFGSFFLVKIYKPSILQHSHLASSCIVGNIHILIVVKWLNRLLHQHRWEFLEFSVAYDFEPTARLEIGALASDCAALRG